MLIPLLLGCATVFITMSIQIAALVVVIRYIFNIVSGEHGNVRSKGKMTYFISMIMTVLFLGNLLQAAIWALLFEFLGEFADFQTAFYHSLVNFASLGYGDIVMSEKWRLLGALEASNGVLMFGVSAGAMLSLINFLLTYDGWLKDKIAAFRDHKHR